MALNSQLSPKEIAKEELPWLKLKSTGKHSALPSIYNSYHFEESKIVVYFLKLANHIMNFSVDIRTMMP